MLTIALTVALTLARTTAYGQQGSWQSQTLSNGMAVRYCQDSTRNLLHLGLTLRGGASLDPNDAQGLARMYEQLFYQYLPDSTPAQQAADQGIFLSHKTQLESHFFGMSLPPSALPIALHLLRDGLGATTWSDSTLDAARNAIVPSLQSLDNAPESHLATELRERLWQAFASKKQTAGRYADLLHIGAQRILTEAAPYRHPANCVLAATGAAPADSFFVAAEATLGQWRPESAGAVMPRVEMPSLQQSIYFQVINEFAAHPLIMMAWPVQQSDAPLQQQRDALHFCALAHVMQGRMYQHLIDSGLVADYTWSWAGGMNPGQLLLYVIPVEDRFAACMSAIQNELAAIGDGGRFSKEEIATANRQIALQAATRHDQSIPRLLESGEAWLLGQATDAGAQSVTLADMEAFARNYVQGRPHVAGLLINSEMVASIGPDTLFRPGTHAISVATVAIAASDDSVPAAHIPQYIDPNTLQKMRVYFSKDPLAADSASLQLLQDIAQMLHDQPQKRIYLNSFSEGLGDGVVNYQLSVARAKTIRAWLVKEQGVPPAQIVIRAYGEAFPELANENDLRNRRMSFEYAPADAQDNVY